jgi:hypothetical protein
VELLQALAWAVKVDDAARARVNNNNGMRNFMMPPEFLLLSSDFDAGQRLNPHFWLHHRTAHSGDQCTEGESIGELKVNCATVQ